MQQPDSPVAEAAAEAEAAAAAAAEAAAAAAAAADADADAAGHDEVLQNGHGRSRCCAGHTPPADAVATGTQF